MTTSTDTIVVGGGLAGIATSAALARREIDHVVLERGDVGESWRSQRWDGFRLNSVRSLSGLNGDGFAPASELVAELERRAATLPVRSGVEVEHVARTRSGRYCVTTSSGTIEASRIVAASGAQRVPRVPAVADQVAARGVEHLHAADYRRPGDLVDGAVLVVGSGQSGVQIAEELLRAGRRVYLATSKVGRMPRRYRGRDTHQWLAEAGFFATTERPPGSERPPQVGAGHSISLQSLARDGAILLGRVLSATGSRLALGDELAEHVRHADAFAGRIRGMVDAHIRDQGIDAPPATPDPADVPVGRLLWRRDLDLHAEGIGTVVWATGFGGDYGWLTMPILRPDGLPYQRGGVTASDGLYTVGVPWQRNRGSSVLLGLESDAEAVADLISERAARPVTSRRAGSSR